MERRQLIWLFLMGVCFAGSHGQRCEPTCFGHEVGDLVANPRNCTQYYKCMPGPIPSDAPFDCNTGMIFDSVVGGCVPGSSCDPTCPPCHLTCAGSDDHIADPFDCSTFYVCDINGPGPAQTCSGDRPYFDGTSCVSDSSVCCNPGCSPYCDHPSVIQVPDPLDCTRYYMCVNNIPQDPQKCPAEKPNFDYSTGHCSSEASCTVLCSDVPPPDSSSTTTTTSPGSSECWSSLTCTAAGLFPACPDCDPRYFQCGAAGQQGILQQCTDDLVFNTAPSYPYCVLPSNCPYTP